MGKLYFQIYQNKKRRWYDSYVIISSIEKNTDLLYNVIKSSQNKNGVLVVEIDESPTVIDVDLDKEPTFVDMVEVR